MSTVRLSEDTRSTIRHRILEHAFKAREAAVAKEERDFALKVYRDIYPKKIRDAMDQLPAGYLPSETSIKVKFEGENHNAYLQFGERLPVAATHQYGTAATYPKGHDLTAAYLRISKARSALSGDREKKNHEIKSVLAGVTTLKQLLEVWPEVESFVADIQPSSAGRALMKVPTELNRDLGLPPKAKPALAVVRSAS